ncbi:MAG: hypothetical protein Q8R36_05010 [bacterium]|nr:hypothetical protein [bacterium]
MIEHQLVSFVSCAQAMELIMGKHEREIETANPLPPKPSVLSNQKKLGTMPSKKEVLAWEKEHDAQKKEVAEKMAAWEETCNPIHKRIKEKLADTMAGIVIVEERGHPDLPEDNIFRSRTNGRCRIVGCGNQTNDKRSNKKGHPLGDAKNRRSTPAFCGLPAHLAVRRQILRKNFFGLRKNEKQGVIIG